MRFFPFSLSIPFSVFFLKLILGLSDFINSSVSFSLCLILFLLSLSLFFSTLFSFSHSLLIHFLLLSLSPHSFSLSLSFSLDEFIFLSPIPPFCLPLSFPIQLLFLSAFWILLHYDRGWKEASEVGRRRRRRRRRRRLLQNNGEFFFVISEHPIDSGVT